ncbi:hypothetical protein AB6D20_027445 (plasmid) [Vibrio splendidus]
MSLTWMSLMVLVMVLVIAMASHGWGDEWGDEYDKYDKSITDSQLQTAMLDDARLGKLG